ncbi:hypothetical protein G6F23_014578 [Rhizopus arrhizus]|nr:hypothetical protein G6F23_014578 [Rhizopus arrhizus]
MPRRALVEIIHAIAPRLHRIGEGLRIGTQHLYRRALGRRHVACPAGRHDRRSPLRGGVETHRCRSARGRAEQLHALQHAADQGDVAVQLARRLAGHHIECSADAAVFLVAAAGAQHAVAMRQPGLAGLRVLADREAVYEAGLRRPAIPVRQHAHLQAGAGAFEFGRQLACGAADQIG